MKLSQQPTMPEGTYATQSTIASSSASVHKESGSDFNFGLTVSSATFLAAHGGLLSPRQF